MKKTYFCSLIALLLYWLIPIVNIVENFTFIKFRFINAFTFIGLVPFSQYLQLVAIFVFLATCILFFFQRTHKISKITHLLTLLLIIFPTIDEYYNLPVYNSTPQKVTVILGTFMWIIAVILFVIDFALSRHRRPTKSERLQAQIDDLQKQVDELKNKD